MWPLTSCHLYASSVTYAWSSPLASLANWMWALSMPSTTRIAAVCSSERFLNVSDTHRSLSCIRNVAGTYVAGAPNVSVTSAYTELSIHLVRALSTTPAGSASAVVHTSSMRMTFVTRSGGRV